MTGGICLKIRRLAATFGRLDQATLELGDGLNILQAPNEAGKSTWCAFLSAMFYGISSRERDRSGSIAEKNRYAPWSGAPMQGRLDCLGEDSREVTLMRATVRAGAPMGAFRALYTGTGDPVPELNGNNCGDRLLGIPRDVFERSAFIRQNSLSVTATPELERRIASLIATGEEGASYTEACDALKRQQNRRRYNTRGEIPAAEAKLAAAQDKLQQLERSRAEAKALQAELQTLEQQRDGTARQLEEWKLFRSAQSRAQLAEIKEQAQKAQAQAELLRHQLQEQRIPENETIGRLRGALIHLETTRKGLDKARSQRDEALKAQLKAEAALSESPFAGQTPEAARREAVRAGQPCSPDEKAVFTTALPAALAGGGACILTAYRIHQLPLGIACGAVLAVLVFFVIRALLVRSSRRQKQSTLLKRFKTTDPKEISLMADAYELLWEHLQQAEAEARDRSAAADTLYNTIFSNEQAILLEVRRFAPNAFDSASADRLLREAAQQRKELAAAESTAREAILRWEVLSQHSGTSAAAAPTATQAPAIDEAVLTQQLARQTEQISVCRSRIDQLTGQIRAIGDPQQLTAEAHRLEAELQQLNREYDALALAIEALTAANTELQGRFSPALGRRTAEIFRQLTGGRYTGVVLDRAFNLSAEPAGDTLYRDARLLSAGAADQLYLAVRLAICELVLPTDKSIPLILDDALINFDDDRCAEALRWLRQEAEHRQILLFTCHRREAAFFRNDPAVQIRDLTTSPVRV